VKVVKYTRLLNAEYVTGTNVMLQIYLSPIQSRDVLQADLELFPK
jgi:hypothetical protein